MATMYKPQGKQLEEEVDSILKRGGAYVLYERIQDFSEKKEVICLYAVIKDLEKLDGVEILVNKYAENNGAIEPYEPDDEEFVYATIKIDNVGPSTELSHSFIPIEHELLYIERK